ncbi:hypothetical protein [Raineyella fluvialis]|uniref:hypothetical protein n=1 Tax=Raineyella fluvialis TaxID=2662261 RepID=UPI001EF09EAC|nr:hypothetical protein [Raineyella fluvialis]
MPKAQIAARLGISRTTVVKAVASDGPPRSERKPAATSFTPFEARVRALLDETPDMPARPDPADRLAGMGPSHLRATHMAG